MLGREACQHERKVQYVQRPISGDILPVNTHRAANWRQLCRTDGYNQQESSCNVLVREEPVVQERRTPRVTQALLHEGTERHLL